MELDLATDSGKLHGTGSDSVGPFTIDGTVDELTIKFTKSYPSSDNGPYNVEYDGTRDGDTYTGTYVIPKTDRLHTSNGGFDLTPPSECSDAIPKATTAAPAVTAAPTTTAGLATACPTDAPVWCASEIDALKADGTFQFSKDELCQDGRESCASCPDCQA
jgi:hypothetical protein